MRAVLVPFDGSPQAEEVLREVVGTAQWGDISEIHVLNVQPALGRYISQFVGARVIREFQRDEGEKALSAARRLLDKTGLYFSAHVRVGTPADTIVRAAKDLCAHEIVMGAGTGHWFGNLLQQILIAGVIRHAAVPVVVVRGVRTATTTSYAGQAAAARR